MSMNTSYTVVGMTCGHCVSAVTSELSKLPGVSDVRVDLTTGTVDVTSADPLPLDDVKAAIDEAGYALTA
jgi:copper chaperone CopZ